MSTLRGWKRGACDPRKKRLIASDSLDVDVILALHAYFGGQVAERRDAGRFSASAAILWMRSSWVPERRIRFSAGWGTFLTNDFRNCNPRGDDSFDPVSLVCKLSDVEGRPAVKLSDNYSKAMGPADQIERYRRIFGTAGVANAPVIS